METEINKNGLESNVNVFDSWFKKLLRLFQINKQVKQVPFSQNSGNVNNEKNRINQLYEKIENEHKHFNSTLIPVEIEHYYSNSVKYMLMSGFMDGIAGIKTEISKQIAESRAQQLFDLSSITLEGRLVSLETDIKSQQEIKERNEKDDKEQNQYYNHLLYSYRFFPKNYSLGYFILYTVCFFVLFLADIPLAVKLIQYGFDILGGDSDFTNLFQDGSFWKTVKGNWEILLTAFGICFGTIYIKIAYEEFIDGQFGHKVLAKKKFIALFINQSNSSTEFSEEEIRQMHKGNKISNIIKISILIFTLITLIILANFRVEAWNILDDKDGNIIGKISNSTLFWTFLSLTLLFPLLAGITLSLSLSILQNRLSKTRAEKLSISLREKYSISQKKLTDLQEEYNSLKRMLEKWGIQEERVKKISEVLFCYYQQGYHLGLMDLDNNTQNQNFFDTVTLWQKKLISRKIYSNIFQNSKV